MPRCVTCIAVCLFFSALPLRAAADAYDPPSGYYSTAFNPGNTLRVNLHNIIDGHNDLGYNAARSALQITDQGPAAAGHTAIITVYDRTVLDTTNFNASGIQGWDGTKWNREHTWPQSRGTGSGSPHSDLFNLRPALVANNSDRGNLNYGGAYGANGGNPGQVTDGGSTYYYPGNVESGVVARQAFYMDVRYAAVDGIDLLLVNGNPVFTSQPTQMGNLSRLIEYHYAVVPNDFERRRNSVIGGPSYQGNRDPFIDRPEWVWSVFVDQANDSSLTLQGGAPILPSAPSGTGVNVNLGRRLIGSALPAGQAVTLNKGGVDGTYYSVTAAGAAVSSVNGSLNAFRVGSTGTQAITVGLSSATSTATAGLRSGTVTIDNLDITGSGGSGVGANDVNDVITVNLSVLDHANASFAGGSDFNTLILDLGMVTMGATAPTLNFSIFDLNAPSGFTAGLDLDTIVGSGSTSVLTTDLAPFNGASTLAAGLSRAFTATMSTSTVGAFSASYTLSFSDENLPGAASVGGLTLMLNGMVEASTTPNADFDGSDFVDGDDLLAWQRGSGATGAGRIDGDADGDHLVDDADLAVWQLQYGQAPPSFAAVPEPSAVNMAASTLALASLAVMRRVRRFAIA